MDVNVNVYLCVPGHRPRICRFLVVPLPETSSGYLVILFYSALLFDKTQRDMSYQPATLGKKVFAALLLGASFTQDNFYLGRLGCTVMQLGPFHYTSRIITTSCLSVGRSHDERLTTTPSPLPPPATLLRLNTGLSLHYIG